MITNPEFIKGGSHEDHRGVIRFVNDFKLDNATRFYTINHSETQTVRAWQGHEIETKYFFVTRGIFVAAWVKIDDFDHPAENLSADYRILRSDRPGVLHLPPGYANGLRALEAHSTVAVFSEFDVRESVEKRRRFPAEKWFDWFQNFEY